MRVEGVPAAAVRKALMKAIDGSKMVSVSDDPGNPVGNHASDYSVTMDSKQIDALIKGSTNVNSKTMGAGMMFLHEYGHTIPGGNLKDASNGRGIKDFIGKNEKFLNSIRRELGTDWGQRLLYHTRKFHDGEGVFRYIPFDKNALNNIKNYSTPPANSMFIKIQ